MPGLSTSQPAPQVPASLLKAIGWVESGWQQFASPGRPLVSFDFGYGIMQITSGMAGAFGEVTGNLDPAVQSEIASDYRVNIAYGARILAQKWALTPRIGDGDPSVLENWYYAVWAYNGWGWVNNPNNPRYSRAGTPASNPSGFPYQDRVLYLVSHPPRDSSGRPLWQPVPVTLPSRAMIGDQAHSYQPAGRHRQPPQAVGAEYQTPSLTPLVAGSTSTMSVRVINSGIHPWVASGSAAMSLTYHLLSAGADLSKPISPFSTGVLKFGQAATPIPHDVLPGGSVTVRVSVTVPASPGAYYLVWDLQQGAGLWLSQLGVSPAAQLVHVVTTPPTAVPTVTPTAQPQATDSIRYVKDTSYPDGTEVQPRQAFKKGWLVFNDGSAGWQAGWVLKQVSGAGFSARTIAVPATAPCRSANIVATLRAPRVPGRYKAAWRMRDPQGRLFGEKLTVVVVVAGPPATATPTPIVTATPTGTVEPTPGRPTPTPTPVG